MSDKNQTVVGKGVLLEPLLRVEDVAQLLSVEPSTVYEWARMEYIPCVRLGTGKSKPCVRFERHAIEQWIEAKRKAGRVLRIPTDND
jgi:excisionase family DNA binding protein